MDKKQKMNYNYIKSISINNANELKKRRALVVSSNTSSFSNTSALFRSIDVNQVTGDFVISNYSNNSIDVFPQSKNSYLNSSLNLGGNCKSITSLGSLGNFNSPLDARFDFVRGKIWVCDTGNNRVIRVNSSTLVSDFEIDGITYPYSIAINQNTGNIFVRGFKDNTTGTIYNYDYSGVLNNYIEFSDVKPISPNLPSPYLMAFDYKKNRLWSAIETTPYYCVVLMFDVYNQQIVQLGIQDETGFSIHPTSIDIDMNSGNIILTGSTTTESYIFQIFRDNCSVLSTSFLPKSSGHNNDKTTLYSTLVSQNNQDIIPFWFIVEDSFNSSNNINFTIESSNSMSISYFTNSLSNTNYQSNLILPESENSKYRHDPFSTVDIIVNSESGVKDVSVRSQKELYIYENPENTFFIPKFSWDNLPFNILTVSAENSDKNIDFLIGIDSDKLMLLNYKNNSINILTSMNTTSEIKKISINNENGDIYLSEYDTLSKISLDRYYSANSKTSSYLGILSNTNEILNNRLDIISYSNSNITLSTEAYSGNVVSRSISDFSIINQYNGFDSPSKVIRSTSHNCYFVAGTNKLWKLTDDGVKNVIYEAKGFKIVDIDCSEKGQICILLNGEEYNKVLVLDNNLYNIVVEKNYEDNLRFCKYCEKGYFYVLGEINNIDNEATYIHNDYVVDTNNGSIYAHLSNNVTNTTSSTVNQDLPDPTHPFEFVYPSGSEEFIKDNKYVIQWQSIHSINDVVSIEIYKTDRLFDTITASTKNTGTFDWQVSNVYPDGTDYQLRGTWLAAGNSSSNSDMTNVFSIVTGSVVTETSTQKIRNNAIGIDYSKYNGVVLIASNNGIISLFDMNNFTQIGNYDVNVSGSITSVAIHDSNILIASYSTKARVFVGSQPYLNDKWDSGVVNTGENYPNYMYYGGGNNLTPGNKYYVSIQTYTEKYGWSEVQTQDFIMPI